MEINLKLKKTVKRRIQQIRRRFTTPSPTPDWQAILSKEGDAWSNYREATRGGPKVLIATSTGGHAIATPVESILAAALTMRGAEVHFLLCDKFLPACLQATSDEFWWSQSQFAKQGPKQLCDQCFAQGLETYQPLGLPIHRYSQLITLEQQSLANNIAYSVPFQDIPHYRLDNLAIGEQALSGALRYFAKGTLESEPFAEAVLRRYFHASLLTSFALQHLVDQFNFDVACFHHGIYVPQGIIGEVCRQRQVRVVNWVTAYRKQCFIFSHDDTYHHTLISEPTGGWENMVWTLDTEAKIDNYLRSRWQGDQDWIKFNENPKEELSQITNEIGIDFSKPTIGLLTNVVWDAQLHYPANAFPNMLDWLRRTIEYFGKRPDLQLLIRVHPAEVTGVIPSRQPVVEEIKKSFSQLPDNIYIIPPESRISTYVVSAQCDSVIIYGTKTGVELTSMGIPVIVAGEAWIRNKGITLDARSADEYFELLDRLPLGYRLDDATTKRARRYAYHFFFRRMIPLECVGSEKRNIPYAAAVSSLEMLNHGNFKGLDIICEGIINRKDFIYCPDQL